MSDTIDLIEAEDRLPIFSEHKLYIYDDDGTETYIKTVYSETMLGIRRRRPRLQPRQHPDLQRL